MELTGARRELQPEKPVGRRWKQHVRGVRSMLMPEIRPSDSDDGPEMLKLSAMGLTLYKKPKALGKHLWIDFRERVFPH